MTAEKTNRTYPIVKGIAYGMFGAGLGLSVTHIYDLFHTTWGASVLTAAFVPVFIDGLQLIGRLARSHQMTESTRRIGFAVQILGATLSLIANVVAGHALGDKVGGAIFVFGYIFMEWFADRMRPATEDASAQAAAAQAATKQAASDRAKRAAATRAANKAAAEKVKRAEARAAAKAAKQKEWDDMVAEVAPVSPAPIGHDAAYV